MKAAVLILLTATLLNAADALPDMTIPTPSGGQLKIANVTLVKVEPDGLRVMHSTGSAKVPFESVPPELHAIYGLNAEKARAHREKMAATTIAPTTAAATPERAPGTVMKPILTTFAEIKADQLAQCSPSAVNPLDRDASRRRDVLAKKAERIRQGKLDSLFQVMAHTHNAKAYLAVGDDAKAEEETKAADKIIGSAETAAHKEAIISNSDIVKAKRTSQAPGGR